MKMRTTLALILIVELFGLSSGLIKQHFFVNKMLTWDSAKNYCRTYFQDLSSFTNENEHQQFLEDAANQTSDAWVGLYRDSGVWEWSGGENATYINWNPNKGPKKDNCAFLGKGSKKLDSKDCSTTYSFFCMNISEIVLVLQKETWRGALEYCRKQHHDLASLSSLNRMDSAFGKSMLAETEYMWIGLRFLAGDWFWLNGDDLNYTALNQMRLPQCPARHLRCGALDKEAMFWIHDCEEKLNFFCSAQIVKDQQEEEEEEEEEENYDYDNISQTPSTK